MTHTIHSSDDSYNHVSAGCTVTMADGEAVSGKLRVTGLETLSLTFDHEATDRLIAGQVVTISTETGTKVKGRVSLTKTLGHLQVCQLSVLNHIAGPPLSSVDDRRATTRTVLPASTNALLMIVQDPDAPVTIETSVSGQLMDISVDGCGVKLLLSHAEQFGGASTATISFALSSGAKKIELQAKRVNTRISGPDHVWIGFQWMTDSMGAITMARLSEYIADLA